LAGLKLKGKKIKLKQIFFKTQAVFAKKKLKQPEIFPNFIAKKSKLITI